MTKRLHKNLFFSRTNKFLDTYLPKQCGRSEYTVESYRDALTIFRKFVYEEKGISIKDFEYKDCTRDLLLDFIEYLKINGKKPTTINHRIAAIRSYVWFSADEDISLQSIAIMISKIPLQRVPQLRREIIDDDGLTAMFTAPPITKIGIRDRLILILLYDTAIRVSELTKIKLKDINLNPEHPYIRIHGKGDKERIVLLSEKTRGHIIEYKRHFHHSENKNDYLIYTIIKGRKSNMSTDNIRRIVNKYGTMVKDGKTNIPSKIHPHMFRRTRATNLFRNDVELEMVSTILGHSNIETTRIYATPSLEMMKEAMLEAIESEINAEKPWESDEEFLAKMCGLR